MGRHSSIRAKEANLGFTGPVIVTKREGNNWETLTGFRYDANEISFQVPAKSPTDFASVPRVFAWLIPRAGDSVPAAILHDHLWRDEAPAGRIAYREADGILRQALRVSGVPFVLRWLCWTAVRWGALTRKNGFKGWWKDFPLVLCWTLAALPVVLPAAILVGAALAVVQVAELVTWVVLYPFSRKVVNHPRVGVKI
jgi:Protein of unknown function (DUF1353).